MPQAQKDPFIRFAKQQQKDRFTDIAFLMKPNKPFKAHTISRIKGHITAMVMQCLAKKINTWEDYYG